MDSKRIITSLQSVTTTDARTIKVKVRDEGERVMVAVDDRGFMDLNWRQAKELAEALRVKALAAEEYAMRERIIQDGAILARAGAPFTLSNRPEILEEVKKEAAWSRVLRRFMPGGVKATSLVGTPTVKKERKP